MFNRLRIPPNLTGCLFTLRCFGCVCTAVRAAPAFLSALFLVCVQSLVVQGKAVAAQTLQLKPTGIATVRFGLPKAQAVDSFRSLFGTPTWQGGNTGCGSRFTEVEWGNLIAEFRAKAFTGYRYVLGGHPRPAVGAGRVPARLTPYPRLATAKGITLGSRLATLRHRYGGLRVAGASEWRAHNGLIFVDDAGRDPETPSTQIIEIKIDTCGAF